MMRAVPTRVVALIDKLFPWAQQQPEQPGNATNMDKGSLGSVGALLDLVDRVPEELLTFTGDDAVLFDASLGILRAALPSWQSGDRHHFVSQIPGFGARHPVAHLRRLFLQCPDQGPAAGTTDLAFIHPAELRDSLRIDISSASRAISNGEWKAATVLAGSVIEALLLWRLEQLQQQALATAVAQASPPPLTGISLTDRRWTLSLYIDVALAAGVVDQQIATAARLTKDFRNLIHPARAQRLQQTCTQGTAHAAFSALYLLIEHLAKTA